MRAAFEVTGPCGPIEAELRLPDGERGGAAVICHPHPLYGGTMHNAVVTITRDCLLARGMRTVRFNFRGVGGSAGTHDGGRGERDDLRAVLGALEDLGETSPWLAGYSFGAAVVLSLLEEEGVEVPGVLVLAPPLEHYDFSFLERSRVPVALIWGEHDALTPGAALDLARDRWMTLRTMERVQGVGHDLGTAGGRPAALVDAIDRALAALGSPPQELTARGSSEEKGS